MSLNSIHTNRQALFALQTLNNTNADLGTVQKRVSTGFRVADARDDGGAYAVAQSVRSDIAGLTAVSEQLGGVKGLLQTTFATLSQVSDTMKQVRGTLTRLADGSISASQRTQYEAQYAELTTQITQFVSDSKYNGRTLLNTSTASGGGDIAVIRNENGSTFSIEAVDGATLQLSTTAPSGAAAAATYLTGGFETVETAVGTAANKLGAKLQYVENQIMYNTKKSDALTAGVGALVDADLAKESANLVALQGRQQLAVQSLSLANQGPSVLLSLFR